MLAPSYGSEDVAAAIRLLRLRVHNVPDSETLFDPWVVPSSSEVSCDDWDIQATLSKWKNNNILAAHLFHVVILSRMFVLDAFRSAWVSACNEKATARTRAGQVPGVAVEEKEAVRRWTLLQIRPELLDPEGQQDIFKEMMKFLLWVQPHLVESQIEDLLSFWHGTKFYIKRVLIDDAQELASKWASAFGPTTTSATSWLGLADVAQPALCPLIGALQARFASRNIPIILSGTKLTEGKTRAAILAGALNPKVKIAAFVDLGGQFTEAKMKLTLMHFFGAAFIDGLALDELYQVLYWLPGR